MAVLKKLKSATLLEALIATTLVVIIFVISSLVLNNVLLNTFSKKTHKTACRINEIEYSMQNQELTLPYTETYEDWEISIRKEWIENTEMVIILAVNEKTGVQLKRKRIYEK